MIVTCTLRVYTNGVLEKENKTYFILLLQSIDDLYSYSLACFPTTFIAAMLFHTVVLLTIVNHFISELTVFYFFGTVLFQLYCIIMIIILYRKEQLLL